MKNKWIYILVGLATLSLTGYLIVRRWMNSLKYGMDATKLKVIFIGLNDIKIQLPIWIYNPSPFSIIVKGFSIDVAINGQYVATINTDNNYMLKSKSTSQYPLIINLPTQSLLKVLADNGATIDEPDWQKKININVNGKVSLESGVVTANNIKLNFDSTLKDWMG